MTTSFYFFKSDGRGRVLGSITEVNGIDLVEDKGLSTLDSSLLTTVTLTVVHCFGINGVFEFGNRFFTPLR